MQSLFDISIPEFAGVAPDQPNPAISSPDWATRSKETIISPNMLGTIGTQTWIVNSMAQTIFLQATPHYPFRSSFHVDCP